MLSAECQLRAGKQKHWILRWVLRVRWNRRACADRCRQIQDVAVGGSVDDVDIATIAAGQIGTGTVAASSHHKAEGRTVASCRRRRNADGRVVHGCIRVGRVRKSGYSDRGLDEVR